VIRLPRYEDFEAAIAERLEIQIDGPASTLDYLDVDSVLVSELAALLAEMLGAEPEDDLEALLQPGTTVGELYQAVTDRAVAHGVDPDG
jgi:acyl carrier protein